MFSVRKIQRQLMWSLLLLSLIPFCASLFLVNQILSDAIALGLHGDINLVLTEYSTDLKELAALDPERKLLYKQRFDNIRDLSLVYHAPDELAQGLRQGYAAYFFAIFTTVILISFSLSRWLSKSVSNSYSIAMSQLLEREKRIKELAHFSQWQTLSAKLAHEIKNPLTPIEMMVGNLCNSYSILCADKFESLLKSTRRIVDSELGRLKNMVFHFSEFAKLSDVKILSVNINDFLLAFVNDAKTMWPRIDFSHIDFSSEDTNYANIDPDLIRQSLSNIIINAQESNLKIDQLNMEISLSSSGECLRIDIKNSGEKIDDEKMGKIFDVGFTTKNKEKNMGLGLAVVKKIMLDHGGEILCNQSDRGAHFTLEFPRGDAGA